MINDNSTCYHFQPWICKLEIMHITLHNRSGKRFKHHCVPSVWVCGAVTVLVDPFWHQSSGPLRSESEE